MSEKRRSKLSYLSVFYGLLILLLAFPIGFVVNRFIPEIVLPITDEGVKFDPILSFMIAAALLRIVLYPFKKALTISSFVATLGVAIMIFGGFITKQDLHDYYFMGVSEVTQRSYLGKSFSYEDEIREHAVATDKVRKFAIENSLRYGGETTLDKAFSLFKSISMRWNYQLDAGQYNEHFRSADETVQTLTGDCEDHSICLATCVKHIGGTMRLVMAKGHIYPELYIGSKKDIKPTVRRINELFPLSRGKNIRISVDPEGKAWLNMDYTAPHPGGKYLEDIILERMVL